MKNPNRPKRHKRRADRRFKARACGKATWKK